LKILAHKSLSFPEKTLRRNYGNNSGIAWGIAGVFEHGALGLCINAEEKEIVPNSGA
jgi:hypothetical protein